MWACGGMVDTLVLGTSAKAWEFESLHAHQKEANIFMIWASFFMRVNVVKMRSNSGPAVTERPLVTMAKRAAPAAFAFFAAATMVSLSSNPYSFTPV